MSLGLNKAVLNAQKIDWTITSNFEVTLEPCSSGLKSLIGWVEGSQDFQDIFSLSIKNIDIPQHTADLIEKLSAGNWHFSRNEDEAYVTTITFRDLWGGTLYRLFKNIWRIGKVNYPDDISFKIEVKLSHDKDKSWISVYKVDKAFMTSISQIQLSHENTEILEFSVEFKSNEPIADYTTGITKLDGTSVDITKNTVSAVSSAISKYSGKLSSALKSITDKFSSAASSYSQQAQSKTTSTVKGWLGWD